MIQTKIDIIEYCYSMMRISGLTVNATPHEVQLALARLESMAAEFDGRNITCGYRIDPKAKVNDDSGLELKFQHMFACNLAVRLLADFGHDTNQSLMIQASQSLASVSAMVAAEKIRTVLPGHRVPVGEAQSLRRRNYQRYYRYQELPPEDASLNAMYIGDINDYREDFGDYLRQGETIISMDHLANKGIDVLSIDIVGSYIDYRVEALSQLDTGVWQQLRIRIKTSLGRVTTRIINFDIQLPVTLQGLDNI